MLYAGTYTFIGNRNVDVARESLQVFTRWTPPAGFQFTLHLTRADGMGGLFVADVTSHAALLEATSTFAAYFDFTVWPVVDITEAVPVLAASQDWLDEQLAELDAEWDDEDDEEGGEDDEERGREGRA